MAGKTKELVLDFNSKKLRFSTSNYNRTNYETIYKNIERFEQHVAGEILWHAFEKIFNTHLFQIMLLGEDTSDLESLYAAYNTIAEEELLEEKIPKLSKKDFIHQLKVRGFRTYRTTVRGFDGKRKQIQRVKREERPIWPTEEN